MEDIRQQILTYSMGVIKDGGIRALTLESIAKNCHISRTTFYKHFGSMQSLISEIHELDSDYDVHTTKDRILLAAIDAFSKTPYPDIDIETIARAINMKRSSVYKYFSTKENLFEESLKMELENRKSYYKSQNLCSMDFKSALNVFFDYISSFRLNGYKNLIFYNALASSQHNSSVKKSLHNLWSDTRDIIKTVLQHGKDSGELKQDFSAETYAEILLSYIGGYGIFIFDDNFESCKETFISMIYNELKAP